MDVRRQNLRPLLRFGDDGSSGTVSPFARRAIRKAPVWTGSARPSMISASTAEAWSAVRWSPAQTASIARLTTSLGTVSLLTDEVGQ